MTFYLKPPDGIIPNHLYQLYAESRLRLLLALNNNKMKPIGMILQENVLSIPRLDSLIEGSIKDRVSHFALRSCVIQDSNMNNFVIYGERCLFRARLKQATGKEMERGVRQLIKHLKIYTPFLNQVLQEIQARRFTEYFEAAVGILIEILKKRLLSCLKNSCCQIHGTSTVLAVPFQQVLKLTSRLGVPLHQGQAHLQCHQIPDYLEELFTSLLKVSSETMETMDCISRIRDDPRLRETSAFLKQIFVSQGYYLQDSRNLLVSQPVQLISLESSAIQYFPPCMSNLYRILKTKHRLCHQPRVQLTLFLKAIGLGINDCIRLIQEEYSKPSKEGGGRDHKCEHSWQKDSRRYIYGTRHLYGLEGSRKKYTPQSCSSMQKNTSYSSCGGCPFVQAHGTRSKILAEDLESEIKAKEFISGMNEEGGGGLTPIESCHKYLCFKLKHQPSNHDPPVGICNTEADKKQICIISNPTDYYMRMKQLSEPKVP